MREVWAFLKKLPDRLKILQNICQKGTLYFRAPPFQMFRVSVKWKLYKI